MALKISIIIPNWNGKNLLEKNLPAVLETKPDEIIVADDDSSDGSVEFLAEKYPQIKIIKHQRMGFAENCNLGVKASSSDIIILLNNDVVPENNFLEPLKKDFLDQKVFAVSFNEPQWSWARIYWQNGFLEHESGNKTLATHISGWASGGSAAFRKAIWEKLGGFDEVYKPFYWEDIDLSYRAWKRGYKILWEPESVVHHKHEGTIGSHFSKDYIQCISSRNQLLFIWKNITDPQMLLSHKWGLIKRLLNPGYWKPFLSALVKLPKIYGARKIDDKQNTVSDKTIFNQFA